MTLDPEVAAALAVAADSGLVPMCRLGAVEARSRMQVLAASRSAAALVQAGHIRASVDGTIDGVPVRTYFPDCDPVAVLVYLHGGGWVVGDLDTIHPVATYLCNALSAVIVSVDYRLAPEAPYPAALDDTYAVLVATADAHPALPLLVGGDSAGGNLAAAAALRARDERGPQVAGQLLFYPFTDPTLCHPSLQENATGYFLHTEDVTWFRDCYWPHPADWKQPYAGPLHADDLRGLPPALVVTAEFDPIRDDGDRYAERLMAAGVPVAHECLPGYAHGFLSWFAAPGIKLVCDELLSRFTHLIHLTSDVELSA